MKLKIQGIGKNAIVQDDLEEKEVDVFGFKDPNHEIEIHLFQRFSKKYSNWDERPRKDYTFII